MCDGQPHVSKATTRLTFVLGAELPPAVALSGLSANTGQDAGPHGNGAGGAGPQPALSPGDANGACAERLPARQQGEQPPLGSVGSARTVPCHLRGQEAGNPFVTPPLPLPVQIIQIAPMPVVQSQLPSGGAVHPGSPFPVSMGTATVMTPGSAPSQTVLLPPPATRCPRHSAAPFASGCTDIFLGATATNLS